MNANPRCLLVGSGYRSIDEKGRTRFVKIDPMDFEQAQWTTRFRMPMVHPSFCFRRVLPDGQAVHYDEAFAVASDYALAASLSAAGPIASIGQPLIRYRMHPENISSTRLDRQRHVAHHISNNRVNDDYPEGVATALGPLLDLLYRKIPVGHRSLKLAIKGIDLAMATDSGGSPPDWMTKRAAGILAEACLGNLRVPGLIQFAPRFILFAPHHLSPLARRFRDLRLRYPSGVATDP